MLLFLFSWALGPVIPQNKNLLDTNGTIVQTKKKRRKSDEGSSPPSGLANGLGLGVLKPDPKDDILLFAFALP